MTRDEAIAKFTRESDLDDLAPEWRDHMSAKFDRWIDSLNEDVVQGEYGYEPGEFTVYPDEWRALYKEGLTPAQAFKQALDAFAEARREDERAKARELGAHQARTVSTGYGGHAA